MSIKQMARVWDCDLSHPQQSILMALADHANDDGGDIFPSVARLAWKTGYSPRQVRNILRQLQRCLWCHTAHPAPTPLCQFGAIIEAVRPASGHRPTEYTIHLFRSPMKRPFREEETAALDRGERIAARQSEPARAAIGDRRAEISDSRAAIAIAAEPSVEPSYEPSADPSVTHPVGRNGGQAVHSALEIAKESEASARAAAAERILTLCTRRFDWQLTKTEHHDAARQVREWLELWDEATITGAIQMREKPIGKPVWVPDWIRRFVAGHQRDEEQTRRGDEAWAAIQREVATRGAS